MSSQISVDFKLSWNVKYSQKPFFPKKWIYLLWLELCALFLIICGFRNVLTSFFNDFHLVAILRCLALCFPTLTFIMWLWIHWKWKKVKMKITQLCLTLCDPPDGSLPGSSVHGILQARILAWVAVPFSRGSSQLRDWTQVSRIAGGFFTIWATREA